MTNDELEIILQNEIDRVNTDTNCGTSLVLLPMTTTRVHDDEWSIRSNGSSPKDYVVIRVSPKTKEILQTTWVLELIPSSEQTEGFFGWGGIKNAVVRFLGMNQDGTEHF